MCSEGNGAKMEASAEANLQSLQLFGGNGGKSPITPGNKATPKERFFVMEGTLGCIGGKSEARREANLQSCQSVGGNGGKHQC